MAAGLEGTRVEAQRRGGREPAAVAETRPGEPGADRDVGMGARPRRGGKERVRRFLATRAAERQERSNGLVPSGFDTWLGQQRARGKYQEYDPDRELHERA